MCNMHNRIISKVKLDDYNGLSCMFCHKPVDRINSTEGKAKVATLKARLINPSSIPHSTEYVTPTNSIIHVDLIKNARYPEMVSGRACNDCVRLLDEVKYESSE